MSIAQSIRWSGVNIAVSKPQMHNELSSIPINYPTLRYIPSSVVMRSDNLDSLQELVLDEGARPMALMKGTWVYRY